MMRSLRQMLLDTGFLEPDTGGDDRLALSRRRLRSRVRVLLRGGILFTLVALLTYFFPIARTNYEHSAFSEGTIAPYEVIAPENFKVLKNETEYGREVDGARDDVRPVLILNAGIAADRQQALDGFFEDLSRRSAAAVPDSAVHRLQQAHSEIGSVSQASLRFLIDQAANYPTGFEKLRTTVRDLLISSYTAGVLNQDSEVLGDETAEVLLVQADGERRISAAPIRGLEWYERSLQDEIDTQFPQGTPAEIKAVYELVVVFLTPNLTYSAEETGRRREEAAARVSPYKGTVLGGERIVDKHDRVTSEHMDQLRSLAVHMNRANRPGPLPLSSAGWRPGRGQRPAGCDFVRLSSGVAARGLRVNLQPRPVRHPGHHAVPGRVVCGNRVVDNAPAGAGCPVGNAGDRAIRHGSRASLSRSFAPRCARASWEAFRSD